MDTLVNISIKAVCHHAQSFQDPTVLLTSTTLHKMAATEKTRLIDEISAKIQELSLLLSTLEADRSRKPEAIEAYRKQYYEMLNPKSKNDK